MDEVKYTIFLSSTFRDLKDERQCAINAILGLGYFPVGMEIFFASQAPPWDLIESKIKNTDYYVLLIAGMYGSLTQEGVSYTEKEYDLAVALGKPVLAFIHNDVGELPSKYVESSEELREKLERFKEKVKAKHTCKFWENKGELQFNIALSLTEGVKLYPAIGWVRRGSSYQPKSSDVIDEVLTVGAESISLKDILITTVHEIEEIKHSKSLQSGISTGYTDLDNITSGWQKGNLNVIASKSGIGKSAFAMNLALNAVLDADRQSHVAFFSLELSASQLMKRLLAATTGVSLSSIQTGRMEEVEFITMTQRMYNLARAPLYIEDKAEQSIEDIKKKCATFKEQYSIQLVIIDNLQLIKQTNISVVNSEAEQSKTCRALKILARELDISIVLLSQLDDTAVGRRNLYAPQLDDIKALAKDADVVMLLYRPDYYGLDNDEMGESVEGETHIHVAKNRNGSTDSLKLVFDKACQKFRNLWSRGMLANDFSGSKMFWNIPPSSDILEEDSKL